MTAKSKTLAAGHRVSVRLPKGTSTSYVQDSTITLASSEELVIRTKAPTPPPVDPPPPPTPLPSPLIPPVPAGATWVRNFADDKLAEFRVITIPSDPNHLSAADGGTAATTDPMAMFNRYGDNSTKPPTPLVQPLVAGGDFLRLPAIRRPDGLYAGSYIATTMDGRGGAATKIVKPGRIRIRFAFRANVADRTWQAPLWLAPFVGDWNDATEIDICEVIKGKLTFNVHGAAWGNKNQVVAIDPPADLATVFHTAGVDLTPTSGQFVFDEKPVGPAFTGKWTHDLAYAADSKVGVPWENLGPTAATPDLVYADVAWIAELPL